ncbi:MAG TPA: hypothetical protein VD833_08695 [Vicinamibacterales bacterium]|nr:hypothetical protein [Vicinamibacterales bacterium]
MTDPLRTDRSPDAADVPDRERDARIEELLLLGLDHYFAEQHELAISVWTRVLFLDRGHARARAYIERARSAVAERQREGEELLHTGVAAFGRGDIATARRLLTSAMERGTATEEALATLDRITRLELAAPRGGVATLARQLAPLRRDGSRPPASRASSSRLAWVATGGAAGLTVAAAALWLWTRGADWLPRTEPRPGRQTAQLEAEPLPVPTAGENSLVRARTLRDRGRLHDALNALEGIRRGDPLRRQADELRAAIQDELLAASRGTSGPGRAPAGPGR